MTTDARERAALENACLRLLARREYSRSELKTRLLLGGYPEERIREVLETLKEEGLQSDGRFARDLAAHRLRQGYGPLRLAAELRRKGVDPEEFPAASKEDYAEALHKAYAKRFGNLPPCAPEAWAARERFLLRRGFSRSDIHRYLRDLVRSVEG